MPDNPDVFDSEIELQDGQPDADGSPAPEPEPKPESDPKPSTVDEILESLPEDARAAIKEHYEIDSDEKYALEQMRTDPGLRKKVVDHLTQPAAIDTPAKVEEPAAKEEPKTEKPDITNADNLRREYSRFLLDHGVREADLDNDQQSAAYMNFLESRTQKRIEEEAGRIAAESIKPFKEQRAQETRKSKVADIERSVVATYGEIGKDGFVKIAREGIKLYGDVDKMMDFLIQDPARVHGLAKMAGLNKPNKDEPESQLAAGAANLQSQSQLSTSDDNTTGEQTTTRNAHSDFREWAVETGLMDKDDNVLPVLDQADVDFYS